VVVSSEVQQLSSGPMVQQECSSNIVRAASERKRRPLASPVFVLVTSYRNMNNQSDGCIYRTTSMSLCRRHKIDQSCLNLGSCGKLCMDTPVLQPDSGYE
jgi:hypothetical protein